MKTIGAATGAILSLAITAAPSVAAAETRSPPLPPCFTQQQVIDQLAAQGYTNIRLSDLMPNQRWPHPELSSPTPADEAWLTPTHRGWNGSATLGGKVYYVYVEPIAPVSCFWVWPSS